MSTPILATKLYIPPLRPEVVLRPRLVARMNEGLQRKLTLISAPAGFGKTTLVSEWVAACQRPVAWLSLDEGHNDPNCFLAYLVATLQTISPKLGEGTLAVLHTPQRPTIESVLTILLNEIVTVQTPFALVLDDYHVIDTKAVDDVLAFLLQHLPAQMHLTIATREDPDLPLARLRGRGQLTELRASDLRFTPTEAAEFLNQAMDLNLSAEDIAALEARTEGWIAGLQLAAISMQGQKDSAGFIHSFTGSHHFVMDYLMEEVLQQQSESIQTFLLRTSILGRLCGPLCDAVLNDVSASSQATLTALQQANLFIVPLDNERRWFRYHHLFADLLRQRLPQSFASSAEEEGGDMAGLHLRASTWFENNGLVIEAFQHALAAENAERAAALAELAWPKMDGNLQSDTWLRWVKELPDELVRVRPVLCIGYAWALVNSGALEAGEARLRDAERWRAAPTAEMVVVDEEQFRALPASIATARGYIAQALGDVSGTVQYARQALDLLPENDYTGRGAALGLLGCTYWTNGDLETAYRSLVDCIEYMKRGGNMAFASTVTFVLADIRVGQGRLLEAVRIYEQSLQLTTEPGKPDLPVVADLYAGLSMVSLERGDLKAAQEYLQRSKERGDKFALADWKYRWTAARARLNTAQGDLNGALDQLDEMERLYFRTPIPDLRPVAALKTRVWLKQGKLTETQAWVRERGLSVDDELTYLREFEHVTLARVLLAKYKNDHVESSIVAALELLERLLQAAVEGGRIGSVIEILILQALAHAAQGNLPMALESLERAMPLAEPEGYVSLFIDEGPALAELLSEAVAQKSMPDYADKLLAVWKDREPQSRNKTTSPPSAQPLLEPLSQREQEILQLIAQGLSNQEICAQLFLALSTVKGHNQNIFGKLQVQRRTEAVARARELRLL